MNVTVELDRPNKVSAQTSEHVLRYRIIPPDNLSSLPLHMAIALDTSASMQGEKLQRAKEALRALLALLRPQDQLSFASYAGRVHPILENVRGDSLNQANAAIQSLTADGVTRIDLALDWLQDALPPQSGVARVAILITDGHATNRQGIKLNDFSPLTTQAEQLANAGISLHTVGLGNANAFNTGFLDQLSAQGRGSFIYADTPTTLEPALRQRLANCQSIVTDAVKLRFVHASGVVVQGLCQFRPDYCPLEETAPNELTLSHLQNTPTDLLIQFQVPAMEPGEALGSRQALTLELTGPGFDPISSVVSVVNTNRYSEAQQVNQEVDNDRLSWELNQYTTELNRTTDPNRTGELLVNIQVNGMKTGQTKITQAAAQQLKDLKATGKLDAHKTTGLLRATRNLGG